MDAHDDVTRIGDTERTAAMEALGEHMRAGRLDPTEYSERAEHVALARTPARLAPLFTDLPAPGPFAAPAPAPAPAVPVPLTEAGRPREGHATQPWGGRAGAGLVAAAPFVAMLIGFTTGFWWAFFLVPLAGALVWGDPKAHRYWKDGGGGYPQGYRRT